MVFLSQTIQLFKFLGVTIGIKEKNNTRAASTLGVVKMGLLRKISSSAHQ